MSTALDLLQHDEICVVVLKDGTQREATWSRNNRCFYGYGGEPGQIDHDKIAEWWPAGAKF